MFVEKRFCRSKVSWQSRKILTSYFLLKPHYSFTYLFTCRRELQAMVKVLQSFLHFSSSLVGLSPGYEAFHTAGLGGQGRGGVVGGLVVVTQPPLTPAEVEQEVDVDLREVLVEALLLLQRDPLQGVAVPVGRVCQLVLPVQNVSILQQLVQQDQSRRTENNATFYFRVH